MDPVTLQVLSGGLRSICEEMGAVLVRSAFSANIKERRDASTALFDAAGQMVMQAEHIPVHLGAMPEAVAAFLDWDHRPGDLYVLNDPYRGGTHLPDITLVSPLFVRDRHVAFAASRAHHADVGGIEPGSTPAGSTELAQEGVVIGPTHLGCDGEIDAAVLKSIVAGMRGPGQREADLRAQAAANRIGGLRLADLAARHGLEAVLEAFDAVLDYAERRTRACIAAIPDGTYSAEDVLEDDARGGPHDLRLQATVEVAGEELRIDFAGTDPQTPGNLNCPLSVTRSAALYVVRVLTDPDIPPSAGAQRPLEVSAPQGCVVNARPPAAVVGGNTETSSRIADLLFQALGQALPTPALGQGTMNNVVLGSPDSGGGRTDGGFTYYETLGGGQGACPGADGPSGVHVAMSNTLNTPVEALEQEFPLRVVEYALRHGSGGAGAWRGGDGLVREVEALEPMRFSLLTERRRHAPRGAAGGDDGQPGRNLRNGGELPSKASGDLQPGDRLRIETPGGGGYGESRSK